MPFIKGMPKHPDSGRKQGSKNKKRVPEFAEYLANKDINPIEQVLNLIPSLEPVEQVKAWMDLASYCQPKPKEMPTDGDDTADDDDFFEQYKNVPDEVFLKIVNEGKEVV